MHHGFTAKHCEFRFTNILHKERLTYTKHFSETLLRSTAAVRSDGSGLLDEGSHLRAASLGLFVQRSYLAAEIARHQLFSMILSESAFHADQMSRLKKRQ